MTPCASGAPRRVKCSRSSKPSPSSSEEARLTGFSELLQQTAGNAWLFVPSAILLGALHGLEPGHSKTMMAAFIVAVRGTVRQAILLALAATPSHTAIVWVLAAVALKYGSQWNAETTEPYFQL